MGLMGRPSRPLAGRHQQRRHAATAAGRARAGRCRHQVRAGRRGVRATGERRYGSEEKPTHDLDGRARQAAGDHAIRRQDRGRDRQGARHLAQRRDRALAPPARDRLPVRHRQLDARQCARRSAEAHKRAEVRTELQSKVIADMIKSSPPSSGVPKERAMEKAFKAWAWTGGGSASISACRSRPPTRRSSARRRNARGSKRSK